MMAMMMMMVKMETMVLQCERGIYILAYDGGS